ncbi:MaoC family dehydratase [Rhodococcus erythropolis]|uniref:MaoC family dehydratase n=1 Tax=Rhodococcus erythropolis TaxID=1833 RepID=UPI002949B9BA|nr:MaoC family dehydratase [Rhodococcus erythropolis]MDV6212746.1 MaoC family dehydratase [Rhodococcus erythropolis]
MSTTIDDVDDLHSLLGRQLESSGWFDITQDRVNTFAGATDDHQWIHVDVERAIADSPYGGPIAHGYLTLSMLSAMFLQVLTVRQASMAVNYGLNKVRFPAPVPVGSKVRLTATVASVEDIDGGVQIVLNAAVDCTAASKPVCVAEPVFRFYR